MPKKGGSPPPPPDPFKTAAAQQGLNVNTALAQNALNQVEEVTPYGRSYYEPTGQVRSFGAGGEITGGAPGMGGVPSTGNPLADSFAGFFGLTGRGGGGRGGQGFGNFNIPMMRRVTEFSPEQQRIFESEMGLTGDLYDLAQGYTGRIAEGLENPFSYEGLPEAPEASEEARQQVIDALYGQATSRLDPRFERDRTALQTRLANQGITKGSDAYLSEMERFGRTRNDAYDTALNSAIMAGGAEQSRLFGLGQSARERAIQERAYLRDRPINEITALTSGRGLTMPQFSPTPQGNISPANFQGAAYNSYAGQLQANQMAQQARSSLISSLAGLGGNLGAAAILSDRRAKTDIKKVGKLNNEIPVYTYRYKGDDQVHIGPMAQDVEKKNPQAVGRLFGLKTVDLNKAVA